jgi:hypothetical protein
LLNQGVAVKTDYTSKRSDDVAVDVTLEGETFTLRPVKKTKVMLGMMKPKNDTEDPMAKTTAAPRALLAWFEDALNRDHRAITEGKRKQSGHGEESVEGCQACRLYDRLNDDDDPLELELVFEVANDLMGEMGDRPTG